MGIRAGDIPTRSRRQSLRRRLFPEPPAPERTTLPPAPFSAARERIRWSRLLPTALLVVLGIGALQLATNSKQTVSASDGSQTGLGLTVTSRQHQLEIRWNREAAAIAASSNGVMKITEAGMTEAVPFDQEPASRRVRRLHADDE